MGKILCATRGGEASYRTQDAAIALAKERGETLLFLYVIDLRFLDRTRSAAIVDVEQEMAKMGQFLLLMAQERADKAGVESESRCRKGHVQEELKHTAREEAVSLVVLGRPAGEGSFFELEGLEAFAEEIEAETGVGTRIV